MPPYLLADLPEASNWLREHNSWSKAFAERDDEFINGLAAQGDLEGLHKLAAEDPKVLHYEDDNGWQVGRLDLIRCGFAVFD